MNEPTPNKNKQKWIALSVLFLFILNGGIYILNHRKTADAPSTSDTEVTAPHVSAKTPQHVTAGGAVVPPPPTGLEVGTGTPGASSHGAAAVAGASVPKGGVTGFFKSLLGGAKSTKGTVGTAAIPGGSAPKLGETAQLQPTSEATTPKSADTCVTVAFQHKATPGHGDEEACSGHKNLIKLPHENIKQDSVCVRVNGTPVHYVSVKGHTDEIVIGAVAGPKSKITVKYCVGKAVCPHLEECAIPKDEFMEAIGGTDGESKNARLGQWDPAHPSEKEADVLAKLDGEVKRELATNEDLNGRSTKGEMFKDWIGENPTPACGMRQAHN